MNSPIHENTHDNFGRSEFIDDKISVNRTLITERASEWRDILSTAMCDFEKFLKSTEIYGDEYSIIITHSEGFGEEDYKSSVTDSECVIYAFDSESARRATVVFENESVTVFPDEDEPYAPELEKNDRIAKEIGYFAEIISRGEMNTVNPASSASESIKLSELVRESAEKNGEIIRRKT